MNGFWGADTEALRTMGTVCTRRADALADLEHLLSSTIENIEWIGEDAERFRADWNGTVRAGLQDQELELRHHARRLAQHADEQEAASAPDGPILGSGGGSGGGWSSPGEFLREVFERAEDALEDLLGGVGAGGSGLDGPFAELLREVLSTPEGRAAFLGAFLGSALGGLLAEMISRALGLGMALENLLAGLGIAAGLSNLLGEAAQLPAEAGAERALAGDGQDGGAGGEGTGGEGTGGGESGSGADGEPAGRDGGGAESGGDGSTGGSDSGGGSGGTEGGSGGEATAADGGGEATGSHGASGLQATETGPAQSPGSGPSGPIRAGENEGPQSLLERLLEMLGDTFGAETGSGSSNGGSASSIGEDIGFGGTQR